MLVTLEASVNLVRLAALPTEAEPRPQSQHRDYSGRGAGGAAEQEPLPGRAGRDQHAPPAGAAGEHEGYDEPADRRDNPAKRPAEPPGAEQAGREYGQVKGDRGGRSRSNSVEERPDKRLHHSEQPEHHA